MGEAKRKTYTPAFKAKVGLEAIRGVKTVNEIGQDHGVHPAQVGQWKREIQEQAETLFEAKRGPKPVDGPGEPDRLYGEIGRLNSNSKCGGDVGRIGAEIRQIGGRGRANRGWRSGRRRHWGRQCRLGHPKATDGNVGIGWGA